MNRIARFALLLLLIQLVAAVSQAQTTIFTYQGRLTDGGNPANGNYDLQFSLFDAATGLTQIGPTLTRNGVNVTSGAFTVQLDFGAAAFSGADRFLEIGVKLPASATFTILTPRQPLSSTPYAIRTLTSGQADSLSSSCAGCIQDVHINSIAGSKITGPVPATSLPPGLGVGWQIVSGSSQQADANTNYVLTGDSEAVITLPAAPNVGDTIRVAGAGIGGFRVAQNDGQTIVGTSLGLLSNWTPRQNNNSWRSIASSGDGNRLIAAADRLYISVDAGATWTVHESSRPWSSVASSADGNTLIAGTGNLITGTGGIGPLYVSTDGGATWIQRLFLAFWDSVACSADGGTLVAAAGSGSIWTSTDAGVTWTERTAAGSRRWSAVAVSENGTKLVAADNGGMIYTSSDAGLSWTARETNRNWISAATSADGNRLVAVVNAGQIYTSPDAGGNWTARENIRGWTGVASSSDGNKLLAVVSTGQIYTSLDAGASWTARESARSWTSAASSTDGTRLAAGVLNGRIYTSSSNTSSGIAGCLIAAPAAAIELQYIGNGRFMPLSHEGIFTAQ
jgi:hypothetical protein